MADERRFPQSIEAEQGVLGGMLMDPERIPSLTEILDPGDFYRESHQKLYSLLLKEMERGEPMDTVGLISHLVDAGIEADFGGVSYVSNLPSKIPILENLSYYARLVREKAVRRRLLQAAHSIANEAHGGQSLEELLDLAESSIFSVSQQRAQKDWQDLSHVLEDEWKLLTERSKNRKAVSGISTGFIDLDGILAGLQKTDLIILAARPAMGKTALALNIAQNVALKAEVGVGIFSLEMGAGQLALRMLCCEAQVEAGRVRTGFLSKEKDWPRLMEASEKLHRAPVWIEDTPGLTINQVRSKARRLKSEHPEMGLIMVDYLQLMQGSGGPRESREQAISSISRGLKAIAKELDLPVIALSQLNRGVESRPNKRPMISDLRESGAIEQDADIIMFIYRDEYYNPESPDKGVAELIVAKQRNGSTGTVRLAFIGEHTRFANLASQNQGYSDYG